MYQFMIGRHVVLKKSAPSVEHVKKEADDGTGGLG